MGELDGKVAIITGAGRLRGIGRAAAEALAKLGADGTHVSERIGTADCFQTWQ